jgi:two-component system, NtrC family, sensor kinase
MNTSKPRALVVHRSLTVRMDVAEALETLGFESHACGTLESARTALENGAGGASIVVVEADQADALSSFIDELRQAPRTEHALLLFLGEISSHAQVPILGVNEEHYLGIPYDAPRLALHARSLLTTLKGAEPASSASPIRRILVIDDSLTYRSQLKEALQQAGHDVLEATTGEEGLSLLGSVRPDAIVVDGVLPGIDGATVVRRVKLDVVLRSIPCLLLTAAEGAEDELRSLEAGADAYVRKSEDLDVILARLVALLRHAQVPAAEDLPSLLAQQRLLAVDDSITYLEVLGEQLRQEGYQVMLANSGEQALELLKVHSVDCILLDLIMPGLSGQETCRRIKATPEWRDVPLMLLTAQDDRDAMIGGINAGADDYIAKSADFDVLKARLRAQLRRKQFEDENRRVRDGLVRREAEISYTRALEQANRELGLAKEHAEKSSRFKSSFLANMSHELRTPLNAIIGFAELLYDGQVPADAPEHREFLGDILTSGRHLQQLINDVLDLSKVEAGKLEFYPESCSLKSLVNEVLTTLRTGAGVKRIKIETALDPAIDEVSIDPARLKQILYNYVSNALKFTPENGCITVVTLPEARGRFRLSVQDTGIGISPKDVERLFTEFEQLDAGAAKRHAGTGLGLALTKRLAEAQGGSVGVASILGTGSTFHAILPRVSSNSEQSRNGSEIDEGTQEPVQALSGAPVVSSVPAARISDVASGTVTSQGRLGTVLVVDDDPSSSRLMAATLTQIGYHPVCVHDPNEGLSIAQRSPPALIVLDLLMPGMNGFEFLEAVNRSNCAHVPVLLWTSKDLSASEYERLAKPAVAVLQKGRGTGTALLEEMRSVLKGVGRGS